MHFLPYLSYVAALAAFSFVTLSLASGLLYIAELIEENSVRAKTIGMRTIYIILALHALLYFTDSLPLQQTAFSMFCHFVYLQNFSKTWPFISLSSLSFLGSCVLVIVDHFVWFMYFTSRVQHVRSRPHRGPLGKHGLPGMRGDDVPTFAQMATFFAFCVWLVPLFLFLSLSASDNALPTASDANRAARPNIDALPRRSLFSTLFDAVPRAGGRRRGTLPEGLIAPSASHTLRQPPSPMLRPTLNDAPLLSPTLAAPPRSPSRSSFEKSVDMFASTSTAGFRLGSPRLPPTSLVNLTPDGVGLGLRPRSPVPSRSSSPSFESTKNR